MIQTILCPGGDPVGLPGSASEWPACSLAPRSWGSGFRKDEALLSSRRSAAQPHPTPHLQPLMRGHGVSRLGPSNEVPNDREGIPLGPEVLWGGPGGSDSSHLPQPPS